MEKIFHHIRKVRSKPEEVRRQILYVVVIIFGIILMLLWIYSLGTNLSDASTQAKMTSNLKPFSVLKDNITFPEW